MFTEFKKFSQSRFGLASFIASFLFWRFYNPDLGPINDLSTEKGEGLHG
jgi:hypothetical protein